MLEHFKRFYKVMFIISAIKPAIFEDKPFKLEI